MKKYKWYLFDLDNTILDFSKTSTAAFKETLANFGVVFSEEIYSLYHQINTQYWQSYEKGIIDADTLRKGRFKDFLKEIESTIDPEQMSKFYLEKLTTHSLEINGALNVLQELSKKADLALITNGLSDVQHKRIAKHQLKKYFQHIFISDELGVSKPDKRFFEAVHQKIETPLKQDVLVLGDNPLSDIIGANNFGYHTLHFNYGNINTDAIKSTYKINDWKSFKV